jgi:hypothetical protein
MKKPHISPKLSKIDNDSAYYVNSDNSTARYKRPKNLKPRQDSNQGTSVSVGVRDDHYAIPPPLRGLG